MDSIEGVLKNIVTIDCYWMIAVVLLALREDDMLKDLGSELEWDDMRYIKK